MEFKKGDKVQYAPEFGDKLNGIFKAYNHDHSAAFIVFHCNNDWENFMDYTGQCTDLGDIKPGWQSKEERIADLYAQKSNLLRLHGVFGGGVKVNSMHEKINRELESLGIDPNS